MFKQTALIFSTALLLCACAGNSTQSAIKNAPKVAGSWQNLGSISNGNIIVSYDAGSLTKNGELVRMRDRKIVVNPNEERYVGTPRSYKVAVSDWEFNCRNRSYRLTAVQFLDERGNIVSQENYAKNPIPPMPISAGTIAEKQFNVACR